MVKEELMKRFNLDRITALREAHRLTPAGFAKKIGKSRQLVWNWEHHKDVPDLESLVKIADTFKVSLDYFFYKEVHQNDEQAAANQ